MFTPAGGGNAIPGRQAINNPRAGSARQELLARRRRYGRRQSWDHWIDSVRIRGNSPQSDSGHANIRDHRRAGTFAGVHLLTVAALITEGDKHDLRKNVDSGQPQGGNSYLLGGRCRWVLLRSPCLGDEHALDKGLLQRVLSTDSSRGRSACSGAR